MRPVTTPRRRTARGVPKSWRRGTAALHHLLPGRSRHGAGRRGRHRVRVPAASPAGIPGHRRGPVRGDAADPQFQGRPRGPGIGRTARSCNGRAEHAIMCHRAKGKLTVDMWRIVGREDVGSASGPAYTVLQRCRRRVGGLGPGLTSESADALSGCPANDSSAGSQVFVAPTGGAVPICPSCARGRGSQVRRPAGACHPSTSGKGWL
jgi:hypothetical protein